MFDKGSVIVEELVQQDERLADFHLQSVNTIRTPTLINEGTVHLFGPFLRMGCGNRFVDNVGAGGFFVNVDPTTGICCMNGVDENGLIYSPS